MQDLDRYLDDRGTDLAIGLILGIALVIALFMAIALSDRRPPDKRDGP